MCTKKQNKWKGHFSNVLRKLCPFTSYIIRLRDGFSLMFPPTTSANELKIICRLKTIYRLGGSAAMTLKSFAVVKLARGLGKRPYYTVARLLQNP